MLNGSVTPPPHQPYRKAHGCVRMHLNAETTHKQVLCSHTHQKNSNQKEQPCSHGTQPVKRFPLLSTGALRLLIGWKHSRNPASPSPTETPASTPSPSLRKRLVRKKERNERRTQVRAKGITLHADSPYLVYLRLYPRLPPSVGSLLPRRRVAWLFMNISWASRPSEGKELLLRSSQSPPLAGFPRQPPQQQQARRADALLFPSPPLCAQMLSCSVAVSVPEVSMDSSPCGETQPHWRNAGNSCQTPPGVPALELSHSPIRPWTERHGAEDVQSDVKKATYVVVGSSRKVKENWRVETVAPLPFPVFLVN